MSTRHHPNLLRLPLLALAIAIGCLSPIAMAVPSSENAALRYWRVIHIFGEDQLSMAGNAEMVYDPEQNLADEGEDPVTVADYLADNAENINLLIEATEFPACDFGIDYDKGVDALLPNLGPMRRMSQILILDAKRLLDDGDADGATERVAACMRLAQHLSHDPVLINSLVSMAVFALAEAFVIENEDSFSVANRQTIAAALARFNTEDQFGCIQAVLGEAQHFGGWMIRRVDNEWSTPEGFASDFALLVDGDPQNEEMAELFEGELKNPEAFRRNLRSQIEQYTTALHLMAEAWNSPDAEKSLDAIEAKIVDGSFGTVTQLMAPALTRCHQNDMTTRAKLTALQEWATTP